MVLRLLGLRLDFWCFLCFLGLRLGLRLRLRVLLDFRFLFLQFSSGAPGFPQVARTTIKTSSVVHGFLTSLSAILGLSGEASGRFVGSVNPFFGSFRSICRTNFRGKHVKRR